MYSATAPFLYLEDFNAPASNLTKKALLISQLMLLAIIWAPNPFKRSNPVIDIPPPKVPPHTLLKTKPIEIVMTRLNPVRALVPMPPEENPQPQLAIDIPRPEREVAPILDFGWEAGPPEMTPGPVSEHTQGLVPPRILHRVQPNYPTRAIPPRLQGTVILEAVMRRDGSIGEIRILKNLAGGKFGFEDAAIQALKQWSFQPGQLHGQPVDVRLSLQISFKLQ